MHAKPLLGKGRYASSRKLQFHSKYLVCVSYYQRIAVMGSFQVCAVWIATLAVVTVTAWRSSVVGFKPFLARVARIHANPPGRRKLETTALAMSSEEVQSTPVVIPAVKITVGQQCVGIAARARGNGIMVNTTSMQSILLPRSKLTRGTYEKLKSLVARKSTEPFRVEVIAVSTNGTLSGKYLPPIDTPILDSSLLASKEWYNKRLNGTVVGAREAGVLVELDGFGVEGEVPASCIPHAMISGSIKKTFSYAFFPIVPVHTIN
jgi:hypothetical protein